MRHQSFTRYFSKIAKSRSSAHFDVPVTPGIASARSSSSDKVPSVFSEGLIPSDKSRSKVAPRPKFSLSAAVAAALILVGGVAARSEKKRVFWGKIAISRPRHFFAKKIGGEVFPCDTDEGPRQNGACCCGRSRENVAQSSLGSWGSKPVVVVSRAFWPTPPRRVVIIWAAP